MTLAHRAAVIAGANPADKLAGYPLGILALRGDLADPPDLEPDADDRAKEAAAAKAAEQNHRRHQAGLIYAGLHAIVHGSKTPRSHLASVLTDLSAGNFDISEDDRQTMLRRCSAMLRESCCRVAGFGRHALDVLDNITVYERQLRFMDTERRRTPAAWAADKRDIDSLRKALGTLAVQYKLERRERFDNARMTAW